MKITSTLLAGDVGEHLVDLRHVAMRADAVGREAFVALGVVEVRLRLAAAAADAALAVDDDALRRDQRRLRSSGARARIAEVG